MLESVKNLIDGLISFFLPRGGRTPEERRRLIRVKCEYEVSCISGNRSFPAVVVDMGLSGLRLQVPNRLKQGGTVYIHHPKPSNRFNNEHVMCTVMWCRRKAGTNELEAGLKYADTPGNMRRSWVKFLLKELGFEERAIYSRRKAIRAPSELSARLRNQGGEALEGRVINLGIGGALFESDGGFSPGQAVRLEMDRVGRLKKIELDATVITTSRQDDDSYHLSLRFTDPSSKEVERVGDYVLLLLKNAAE